MIQFNLLPDVKLEYIKAQRTRRLVTTVSLLVSGVAVALLVLLLVVNGIQKKHLSDLSNDINTETKKLQNQPDIGRILTVQNQLTSLTGLHDSKPAASKAFDYLNQLTPAQVAITNFNIDMAQQIVTITGKADALSSVNKYVDTLKFTTYKADDAESEPAFSDVVLTSFGLSSESTDGQPANYTLTMAYDKNIFDITKKVKLTVPKLTTTRSALANPTDLFKAPNATSSAGGSN